MNNSECNKVELVLIANLVFAAHAQRLFFRKVAILSGKYKHKSEDLRQKKKSHIDLFINTYSEYKNNALYPEPKFQNSSSLSHIKNDILIYFQEGTGDAVNYFWKQVQEQNLGFKRENKLIKILKRKKIKNQIEYDFIVDVMVPYQQQKLINDMDFVILSQMISAYEKNVTK